VKPDPTPDAGAALAVAPAAAPVDAPKPKPQPPFLRRHLWQLLAAAVVLIAGGVLLVRWWMGPQVATQTVLRRDLIQTVVASGRVEAPHRLEIGAQIIGTVLHVPVAEGQAVHAGDLLVELEAAELAATGRQADVAVQQAQARLRQLQEVQGPVAAQGLRQARATLANARATLARSQDLFGQGFIGQAALDDARQRSELADAGVRSAQKQLDTTLAAGSDRALALANVAGARASAQAARARTGYAQIRAPVNGTLIARSVEVGDVVQPGNVLMTLSPRGRTQLVLAIDEKNLALLALGQQALVSADAYPAQRFCGHAGLHQPRRQREHRRRGGQARRGHATGRAQAGHDGVGGHRGGAPRAGLDRAAGRRARHRCGALGVAAGRPARGAPAAGAGPAQRRSGRSALRPGGR
jgi:HlyD family secretion protein